MFRRILNRKYLYIIFPVVVLLVAVNVCLILAKYGYFSSLASSIGYKGTLVLQLDNIYSSSYYSGSASVSFNSTGQPILQRQNISPGGYFTPPGQVSFQNLTYGTYYVTAEAVLYDQKSILKKCQTLSPKKIVFNSQSTFFMVGLNCSNLGGPVDYGLKYRVLKRGSGNPPVSGVSIKISNPSRTCTTNASGECEISFDKLYDYVVTFSKAGYLTATYSDTNNRIPRISTIYLDSIDYKVGSLIGAIMYTYKGRSSLCNGATIKILSNPPLSTTSYGVTSSTYNYFIDNVPAGTYNVQIIYNGRTQTQSVTIQGGQRTKLDINFVL